MLKPFDALAIERARVLIASAKQDDGFLRGVLVHDAWWTPNTLHALSEICAASSRTKNVEIPSICSKVDLQAFFEQLLGLESVLHGAIRRFRNDELNMLKGGAKEVAKLAKALETAEQLGISVCKLLPHEAQVNFACHMCCKTFGSSAALATHLSITHGLKSELGLAARGTTCQSCMRDFRCTPRLLRHLYAVDACKRRYLAADIGGLGPIVKSSKGGWQPPVNVSGPLPFWATLEPQLIDTQRLERTCLLDSVVALASACNRDDAGRERAGFAQKLFALFAHSKLELEGISEIFDSLPINTPCLDVICSLSEAFIASRSVAAGRSNTGCFQAQWQAHKMLIAPTDVQVPVDVASRLLAT